MPNLYVIAGPNGAGKTTFAKEFLPKYAHCINFINADLIALGLAPFSPAKVQNVQLAQQRIKQRVKEGGHHVPTADIKRRFKRSWQNFKNLYTPLTQSWFLFDNSGLEPIEIAKCDQGKIQILNKSLFQKLMEERYGQA